MFDYTLPKPKVPNAPCGVEREKNEQRNNEKNYVPNAPCGVESYHDCSPKTFFYWFLMHRVELKEQKAETVNVEEIVFLMHRVELKE